ncbi:MAG: PQQ-binding-like beta-propeller repeat protein [Saccharothrix sp.]|nr:PQQ-binding-like beta-propeller repeat protein [Saccharothrix sp.]
MSWERPLHQAGFVAGVAVGDGCVVVHERGTRLVCLDAVDGAVRWDVPIGTWPRAVVVAGARCLVLPQSPRRLVCLDLATGRREWTVEFGAFVGHLVVARGTVLVGGWRGYAPLRALDVETGELLATADIHTVWPAAVGGGFLVAAPGGTAVRLVDHDLREVAAWSLPERISGPDHAAVFTPIAEDRYLVRCGARTVVEVGPGGVREFVRAERDLTVDAPVLAGGLVWLRERSGGYTTAAGGRLRWRFDIGQPLVGGVHVVDGGFAVAALAGTLFRLDPTGQILGRAQVARRITALEPSGLALTKGTLLAFSASLLPGLQRGKQ